MLGTIALICRLNQFRRLGRNCEPERHSQSYENRRELRSLAQ